MAYRATKVGAALLSLVAACGGKTEQPLPGGAANHGTGGLASGGAGGTAAGAGNGGSGAVLDEPWDSGGATLDELCAMAGTPVSDACTTSEMRYRLSRRWWQCSGTFLYATQDSVGVEFADDGRWYLLVQDETGAAVRGTGPSYQGTWDMQDTSSMNGPCSVQVDINQGGMLGSFPLFRKKPTRVNLNTGGDGGAPIFVAIP